MINADDDNLVALAERLAGRAVLSSFAVEPAVLQAGPQWLAKGDNPRWRSPRARREAGRGR